MTVATTGDVGAVVGFSVTTTANVGTRTFAVPMNTGDTPFTWPRTFTVQLPSSTHGSVAAAIDGVSAADAVIAMGTGSASVSGDGRYPLSLSVAAAILVHCTDGVTSGDETDVVATVEAYVPALDRWSTAPSLLTARTALTSALGGDGRILAIGGVDENGTTLSSVEAFGPVFTMSSMHAPPGTMLFVQGNNFAANATVTVTISTQPPMQLGTGMTDAKGVLDPFTIVVPTVPANCCGFPIHAIDSRSRYRVTWPFVVDDN